MTAPPRTRRAGSDTGPPTGHASGTPPRPGARRGGDPLVLLPTLLGALAVLGGSTALLPLLDSTAWLLPLTEVVAVVWLVGIGSRLLSIRPWGTELLQLAALVIALTSLFTRSGIAGVLPGPAAVSEAATMLSDAWEQVLVTVPPAPTTPDLELLIALCIGIVALVVDLLIAGARVPALVALPLLSLYSVPASIDTHLLPWYAFVLPATLFVALLAVAGHAGWHLQSQARTSLGVSGTAIAAVAVIGALLLADAITPIGTAGRLPRGNHAGGDVGLNPWALLHGDLKDRTPVDTLLISGLDEPAYLRTIALEKWVTDKGFMPGPVVADEQNIDGDVPGAPAPTDASATVTITPQKYRDHYLPIYPHSTQVTGLAPGWNYDEQLQTVFRDNRVVPGPYTVTANMAIPTAAELETENVHSGGPLTETGTLPAAVVARAKAITADARTPFEAAQELLHYFKDPANGFTYSLSTPTGNSGSALLDFLNLKKGYCEQYAAAMAIMLRALGIPSRVAIGFTQGAEQPDGSYQITSTDAHAWVEVKFDTSGWVAFDPTPVVGGQGGLQGYQAGSGSAGGGAATTNTTTASSAPTATESADASATGPLPKLGLKIPEPGVDNQGVPEQPASSVWSWLLPVVLVIVALLVLAALLALPSLLRASRRRRRLGLAAKGAPGAGTAAWSEIEDTLTDHGIALHDAESARVTANRLARTAHLSTSARDDLRSVVVTAEREWYGTPVEHQPDLSPGVRAVVDGLEHSAPRPLADRLLPRSMRSGGRRARSH